LTKVEYESLLKSFLLFFISLSIIFSISIYIDYKNKIQLFDNQIILKMKMCNYNLNTYLFNYKSKEFIINKDKSQQKEQNFNQKINQKKIKNCNDLEIKLISIKTNSNGNSVNKINENLGILNKTYENIDFYKTSSIDNINIFNLNENEINFLVNNKNNNILSFITIISNKYKEYYQKKIKNNYNKIKKKFLYFSNNFIVKSYYSINNNLIKKLSNKNNKEYQYIEIKLKEKIYINNINRIKNNYIINYILILSGLVFISLAFAIYSIKPLKESLKITNEFIKDFLHDVNTPLSSILLNINILEKKRKKIEEFLKSSENDIDKFCEKNINNKEIERINNGIQNILQLQNHLKLYLNELDKNLNEKDINKFHENETKNENNISAKIKNEINKEDILKKEIEKFQNILNKLIETNINLASTSIDAKSNIKIEINLNLNNNISAKIKNKYNIYDKRNINRKISLMQKLNSAKIDKEKLNRIILNLITNAYKYNIENGFIKIDLYYKENLILKKFKHKLKQEEIVLEIINPSYQKIKNTKKIFNRFYKENERGIGIGLHIVKKLINEINKELNIKQNNYENYQKIKYYIYKNIINKFLKINLSIEVENIPLNIDKKNIQNLLQEKNLYIHNNIRENNNIDKNIKIENKVLFRLKFS
jgi:signal transduction histidine kinase